jgi:hypothetical protein
MGGDCGKENDEIGQSKVGREHQAPWLDYGSCRLHHRQRSRGRYCFIQGRGTKQDDMANCVSGECVGGRGETALA